MSLLAPNLHTVRHLLERNRKTFRTAISKSPPIAERREAWRRLATHRRRAFRLIEEVGLRTQRLQAPLERLREISDRMNAISQQLTEACSNADPSGTHELRKELRYLMKITLESPARSSSRSPDRKAARRIRCGQAQAFGRQPAVGSLHRQALPQPGPELPGPDPGREYGTAAGVDKFDHARGYSSPPMRSVDPPGDYSRTRRSQPDDPRAGEYDREDEHSAPG